MFFTIRSMPVRPVPTAGWRAGSGVEHPVDQPRDGPHLCRVALPPMSVHVTHRREPPQPPDPVLHDDPTTAERAVVAPVLRRALLPARLATRARAQTRRVQRADPDVTQVPDPADPLRETRQQPGPLEQLDVLHDSG